MEVSIWTSRSVVAASALLCAVAGCNQLEAYVSDLSSVAAPDSPAPRLRCSTPVTATGPFARNLVGKATFELADGRGTQEDTLSMQVYFPAGRAPGAPVFFAHHAWPFGTRMVETVLSPDGSASFEWSGTNSYDFGITGTLIGPDDGIDAAVTRTFADANSENPVAGRAEAMLCPDGVLPNPTVSADDWIAPDSDIRITASNPIDPSSVVVSALRMDATALDVDAVVTSEAVTVTSRSGAFPPGESIYLSLGKVTDVVGNRLPAPDGIPMVHPVPPVPLTSAGAAFEGRATDHRVDGLILLGERGAATTARVKASWAVGCMNVRLAVVSDAGQSSRATLAPGARTFEGSVALPGTGKQWLSVHAAQSPWLETWTQGTPCRIEIAAATLE